MPSEIGDVVDNDGYGAAMQRGVDEAYVRQTDRPWGSFRVLDESASFCKVKSISVDPGRRLSLQSHAERAEHWFFVSGVGTVWKDEERIEVGPGSSVDIPIGTRHRAHCTGAEPLVFIEVQHGSYFGEDDIVRYEDDYGRAGG